MKVTQLFVLALVAALASAQCTYYSSTTGCSYDVSKLTLSGPYYTVNDDSAAALGNFTFNICGSVEGTTCTQQDTAVCQYQSPTASYYCGVTPATLGEYAGADNPAQTCPGVTVSYANGQMCTGIATARTSNIYIGCDPTQATPRTESVTEIQNQCIYNIQMWSADACGTVVPTPVPTPTATATNGTAPSTTPIVTPVQSMPSPTIVSSVASPVISPSNATATVVVSVNATAASVTPTPSESSSGISVWVWVGVGAGVLVVILAVLAGVGFFLYKKKQREQYDSIGYDS